jgi:RNA polymerase sigma factor (sigma-70 family)
VFTIAHHLVLDDRRRRSVRITTSTFDQHTANRVAGGDVEDEAIDHLRSEWVTDALALLSPDQRTVVTLRVIGDLSIEQVAVVVGKPVGAVKALQRRGIAALRRHMTGARDEGTVTR